MGNRTVVILFNDEANQWENDPELGKKIVLAMHHATGGRTDNPKADLGYGRVVECAHADVQTLGFFDSYHFNALHHGNWRPNESDEATQERLLREAADKLGYVLHKKPQRTKAV